MPRTQKFASSMCDPTGFKQICTLVSALWWYVYLWSNTPEFSILIVVLYMKWCMSLVGFKERSSRGCVRFCVCTWFCLSYAYLCIRTSMSMNTRKLIIVLDVIWSEGFKNEGFKAQGLGFIWGVSAALGLAAIEALLCALRLLWFCMLFCRV